MINKISPHPSLPKEGERKGRNDPTISGDQIDLDPLLGKIGKYGLEQEWKKAQKISEE